MKLGWGMILEPEQILFTFGEELDKMTDPGIFYPFL